MVQHACRQHKVGLSEFSAPLASAFSFFEEHTANLKCTAHQQLKQPNVQFVLLIIAIVQQHPVGINRKDSRQGLHQDSRKLLIKPDPISPRHVCIRPWSPTPTSQGFASNSRFPTPVLSEGPRVCVWFRFLQAFLKAFTLKATHARCTFSIQH